MGDLSQYEQTKLKVDPLDVKLFMITSA